MNGDPTGESSGAAVQRALEKERFENWKRDVFAAHDGHAPVINEELYWSPLDKPLSRCSVAIVSTLGVHGTSDVPFDIENPEGDPSIRYIPEGTNSADLMATHGHLDTDSMNRDINVGFPIDRLRDLVSEGRVGALAKTHYGIMGWCPRVERMRDEVAPQIIRRLEKDNVDAVLLVPG